MFFSWLWQSPISKELRKMTIISSFVYLTSLLLNGNDGPSEQKLFITIVFFSKLISNTRKLKLFISLLELLWRDLLLSAYSFVKSNKIHNDQSKSLICRPTVIKKSLCLYTVYLSVDYIIELGIIPTMEPNTIESKAYC